MHIFNRAWPPHAKFHKAQTLGVMLGAFALFFSWRRSDSLKTDALAAALFAKTYWATQFVANEFLGVAWTDPEFLKADQKLAWRFPPQRRIHVVATLLVTVATALIWPRQAR